VRGLALAGAIAIAFGLGSNYATGELGAFGRLNLGAGAVALILAAGLALRRSRGFGTPLARGLLIRRAAILLLLTLTAIGLERATSRPGLRFDWTLDQRHALSPAVLELLGVLPADLSATLFYDAEDPRVRGTRVLLESFRGTGAIAVRERLLDDAATDADRFGITSSNSVVLETGGRFELVGRPSEGSIWEALERLRQRDRREIVYYTRGAGEGDLRRSDELGFSGLAEALATEGYLVRDLVLPAAQTIPDDAAALLMIAPERGLRPESLAILHRYLEGGGGLLAFLEPGRPSGLAEFLAKWGFDSPDAVVVDPAAGPVEGGAPGVHPLAHSYGDHPITRLLDANRMTFFLQARPVEATRKPRPEDRLKAIVYSSPRAWLSTDLEGIARGRVPRDRDAAVPGRFALVSAGAFPRAEREARIVAFGDSGLASNGYLRALYNLDLVMNAVAWVAQRPDSALTRRPNMLTEIQSPLTPQQTLTMFYGAGLLLPELLLIAAGLAWIRRRTG
jgi:hypothetical protein